MSSKHPDPPKHCGQKRRADLDLACSGDLPSAYKKQRRDRERSHPNSRYWDTLSKVRLSRRALREFDRRRRAGQEHCKSIKPSEKALTCRDIKQFARRGGPSLAHLRGYANSDNMSQHSAQSRKRSAASGRPGPTGSLKSSPYSLNYEQKLIDHKIYPREIEDVSERPLNEDEILTRLTAARPSLSPSRFTEQDFRKFRQDVDHASTETSTMQKVFPTIEGRDHGHRSAADVTFTCIEPMAEDLSRVKPDLYDGAAPENINAKVRASLQEQILPSNQLYVPAAPNFFTEGKSPSGRADVARLQACVDGATGTRAMSALQNYGQDTPAYDGKAYSFSCTYYDGMLKMYAHHSTGPRQPEERPTYHMTQLDSIAITGNITRFKEGVTAYRNLRDYAKKQRDSMINQANQRASVTPLSASSSQITSTRSARTASLIEESDTSPDELSRDEVLSKRIRPTT